MDGPVRLGGDPQIPLGAPHLNLSPPPNPAGPGRAGSAMAEGTRSTKRDLRAHARTVAPRLREPCDRHCDWYRDRYRVRARGRYRVRPRDRPRDRSQGPPPHGSQFA
ncbi:hypothetical protein GCM10010433_44170 [Streptomyces pulveraceus]